MAVQTLSVARRDAVRPLHAQSIVGGTLPGQEPARRRAAQRGLSDVDAWALPFDLACGASAATPPRGPRVDTQEVWS